MRAVKGRAPSPGPAGHFERLRSAFLSAPRPRVLDRYVGLAVLRGYVLAMLVLLTVFSFLAFVEELDDLGKGRYRLLDACAFIAATTPRRMLDLVPVTTLLGSLTALGTLASGGELIAMQAAGVSMLRIGWSVLRPAVLLMVAAVAAAQFVAPPLDQASHVRRARLLSDAVALQSEHGFWSRDGLRFLHVRDVAAGDVLGGVEVYEFDDEQRLRRFIQARRAEIEPGRHWLLVDVRVRELGPDGIVRRDFPSLRWESFLGRAQVDLLALPPATLSFSDLYRYVRYLRRSGQDAGRHELALWQKASMPLAAGAMVLLAIPFTLGLLRRASAGQRLMLGSLVGVGFHLASQIIARLGLLLNLSPAVTALAPVGIVLVAALWLFRRVY